MDPGCGVAVPLGRVYRLLSSASVPPVKLPSENWTVSVDIDSDSNGKVSRLIKVFVLAIVLSI